MGRGLRERIESLSFLVAPVLGPGIFMLEAATLLIFPLLMIFAAISDLLTMTISNWISLMLGFLFMVLGVFCGLPAPVLLLHLACGVLVLVLTFGLFAKGWIGGGDAKLAAATAIWLGFDHVGDYALYASVIGGLLTLFILGVRQWPLPGILQARQWAARLHDPATGIPYGIALASAGLLLYPGTVIWIGTLAALR